MSYVFWKNCFANLERVQANFELDVNVVFCKKIFKNISTKIIVLHKSICKSSSCPCECSVAHDLIVQNFESNILKSN